MSQSFSESIHIGDIGEAICYLKLLQLGVAARIVNLGTTDIIAMEGDISIRIQVKSASMRYVNDRGKKSETPNYGFSVCTGSKVKKPLTEADCDIIALVGIDHEEVNFVHISKFGGMKMKRLRATEFDNPNITAESWQKASRPFRYGM